MSCCKSFLVVKCNSHLYHNLSTLSTEWLMGFRSQWKTSLYRFGLPNICVLSEPLTVVYISKAHSTESRLNSTTRETLLTCQWESPSWRWRWHWAVSHWVWKRSRWPTALCSWCPARRMRTSHSPPYRQLWPHYHGLLFLPAWQRSRWSTQQVHLKFTEIFLS